MRSKRIQKPNRYIGAILYLLRHNRNTQSEIVKSVIKLLKRILSFSKQLLEINYESLIVNQQGVWQIGK